MKAVSIVLGLLLALASAGCRESPPRAVEVRADGVLALTAVSFNLRYEGPQDEGWRAWPARVDRVVGAIRTLDPDVLGIQEALHGQAADLRASLPDFDFEGVGRDDGQRAGEYAGILWKRDRFEQDPDDRGTFWLSDHPDRPGSRTWGNSVVRAACWVRLTDRASGRSFYVFNTHWDHRHQGSRERSALLMAERIDSRRHPGDPVILLGDFNGNEDNPAVAYLAGRPATLAGEGREPWPGAMIDPWRQLNPRVENRRTLHFWRGHREGAWKVDHILVSRGARVVDAGIHHAATREAQPSDHYPVWVRVEWD